MTPAYPLQWPAGWPRTQNPSWSRFSPGSASKEAYYIRAELERLGATNIVINSNMQYKPDGTPYARQSRISDSGVAVYFTLDGSQQCIPCDRWTTVEENMRAVWKTIEALRGIDRWGAKENVKAAFSGFKALPETAIVTPYTARPWHEILQVSPTASPEVIRAAYKQMAFKSHPDHGGTDAAFHEVQRAYKQSGAQS